MNDSKNVITPVSDFVFFDPVIVKGSTCTACEAYLRIGKRGKQSAWRISFGQSVKARILEKECRHIRFCENSLTGEVYVVFVNDPTYLEVKLGKDKGDGYTTKSPYLCSKQAYVWLTEKLGVSNEELPAVFDLGEDLSRTNAQITYKIGKRL